MEHVEIHKNPNVIHTTYMFKSQRIEHEITH